MLGQPKRPASRGTFWALPDDLATRALHLHHFHKPAEDHEYRPADIDDFGRDHAERPQKKEKAEKDNNAREDFMVPAFAHAVTCFHVVHHHKSKSSIYGKW